MLGKSSTLHLTYVPCLGGLIRMEWAKMPTLVRWSPRDAIGVFSGSPGLSRTYLLALFWDCVSEDLTFNGWRFIRGAKCTYNEDRAVHRIQQIRGKKCVKNERCLRQKLLILLDKLIDPGFSIEMRDCQFALGELVAVRKRAPEIVLQTGSLGSCSGQVDALLILHLCCFVTIHFHEGLEEIGDCEDSICTLESLHETGWVVQVSSHHFDTLRCQALCFLTVQVAGNSSDLEALVFQDRGYYRPSLTSSGTDNDDKLRHDEVRLFC
jgi:hypothetical protein